MANNQNTAAVASGSGRDGRKRKAKDGDQVSEILQKKQKEKELSRVEKLQAMSKELEQPPSFFFQVVREDKIKFHFKPYLLSNEIREEGSRVTVSLEWSPTFPRWTVRRHSLPIYLITPVGDLFNKEKVDDSMVFDKIKLIHEMLLRWIPWLKVHYRKE